jgi:hypothetical protein
LNDKNESLVDQLKRQMNEASENGDIYSNFLFAYFNQTNKDKVKISNLTLHLNNLPPSIDHFIEHLWVAGGNFVEVKKKKKNYAIFKLTESGKLVRDTFEYDKLIVKRNYFTRIIHNIYFFIKFCKKTIFESIPNFIEQLFSKKSGNLIMKIIGVLSALLGFIWLCIEMFEWAVKKGFINLK